MRMLKKEKIIVMLAMSSFVIFCVFGFVYLPELKAGTQFAYKQIKDAGPDLIGLIPPVEQLPEPNANIESPLAKYPVQVTARAKLVDMARLQNKIKEEMNVVNRSQGEAVLPQPFSFNSNGQIEHGGVDSSSKRNFDDDWQPAELPSGEAKDSETKHRRDVVRDMMKHAWKNYVDFAWGENELRPISKRGHSPGIFGRSKLGASIVDAMDTLFIMGLKDEFKMGRDWIADNLSIENMHTDISVFEFTIRFIAGLLTCYSLTKDSMFLEKANSMADSLLPAFNSPKGIPYALINPKTGFAKNYVWAASGCSILSEIGTLHLEMVYLSDMVKNPIYKDKVMKVRNLLQSANKPNGLYPNYVNPKTGAWCQHHISVGALGDSFYEYLLKAWIQSGGRDMDARKMYDEALDSIEHHLLQTSATNKLLYFAEMKYERLEHKMDHLACFIGGLIGLGAQSLDQPSKKHYTDIAAGVTSTCHESYDRTATKIGPESFRFTENIEAKATRQNEKYYILRPEVIESYFYMWRLTKDQKYRDWAWEAVQAIEKHCRVENGYSGLKNVYDANSPKDDVQQSFFFAEVLKYLYLIFSEDNLISLDEWVFNTEAHPLPIKGKNPAYPA